MYSQTSVPPCLPTNMYARHLKVVTGIRLSKKTVGLHQHGNEMPNYFMALVTQLYVMFRICKADVLSISLLNLLRQSVNRQNIIDV